MAVTLLAFTLGDRRLALAAGDVQEIVRAVAIAALPRAPAIMEGVVNLRGTVVPVLDVRKRFGMAPVPLAPDQHFIIARAGSRQVALRVDRAHELIAVDEAEIEPVERAAPGAQYVAGLAKLPDGVLVIHDLDRFLSLEEAEQMDAALDGAVPSGRRTPTRGAE